LSLGSWANPSPSVEAATDAVGDKVKQHEHEATADAHEKAQ
jgi:hypothetical protein